MVSFIPVAVLVIFRIKNKKIELFMQKRTESGPLDGLLEFPGGKVEYDESPQDAALREFCEEVQVISGSCSLFKIYKHDYTDRSVCLFVNIMRVDDKDFCKGSWLELPTEFSTELWALKVPEANIDILKDLTYYLHKNYGSNI